jgi:hypothetical protein
MSLGDSEHKISILFESRVVGAHVKVTVRAGHRGSRALLGNLVFRPEEWVVFRECLGQSREVDEKIGAMLRYAPEGHESRLEGVKLVHLDTSPIEVTG